MTISAVHDRVDKEPTELEKGPRKSEGYAFSSLPSTCARHQTGLFCIIKCTVLQLWRVSSMPRARPERVYPASLPPSNTQRTSTTSTPREYPSPVAKALNDADSSVTSKQTELMRLKEELRELEECDLSAEYELDGTA